MNIQQANHFPNPINRASAKSLAHNKASINAARRAAKARNRQWAPQKNGNCACGCGNKVNPRRLALGYGLTIKCATRIKRR